MSPRRRRSAASLAAASALLLFPAGAAAAASPVTFAQAGDRAVATLLGVFYAGGGMWRQCDRRTCPTGNQDWGADSLTCTLYLRWLTAHDPAVAPALACYRTPVVRAGLLSLFLAAVFAANASAGLRTTKPSELTKVGVSLTDNAVKIARDRFTKGSLTRFPRGAIIEFVIVNRGTKPYRAELFLNGHEFTKSGARKTPARTRAVKPGGRVRLQVNFYFRSRFTLKSLANGKSRASAPILIF